MECLTSSTSQPSLRVVLMLVAFRKVNPVLLLVIGIAAAELLEDQGIFPHDEYRERH